jgi:hypothetical protein
MRRVVCFLAFTALLAAFACDLLAEAARPQFRPALLGSKPDSLINQIDSKELAAKGEKDGAVMFCALINEQGKAVSAWTYRALPGTGPLEEALNQKLQTAQYVPAIYNYQPVTVLLYGSAIYSSEGGKPSLRIFLNQDLNELKKGSDFIGPQPVLGAGSGFQGLTAPPGGMPIPLTAIVDLGLKVDAKGEMVALSIVKEDPPLLGFADAAVENFRGAKFIPAFRDGDPEACDTILPVCYKPVQ